MKVGKTKYHYLPTVGDEKSSTAAIREDRCEFFGVNVDFVWLEGCAVMASYMYNEMTNACTLTGSRAHTLVLLIVAWVERQGFRVTSFTPQQDHFDLPSARVVVSMMIEPGL